MGEQKLSLVAKTLLAVGGTLILVGVLGLVIAAATGMLPASLTRSLDPYSQQAQAPAGTPTILRLATPTRALAAALATMQAQPTWTASPSLLPTATATPAPTLEATMTAGQREEISTLINQGNAAQTLAYKTQDGEPLRKYYTGVLLEKELKNLERNKELGIIEEHILEHQEFRSFRISPDGKQAQVTVDEVWTSLFYEQATNICRFKLEHIPNPQTVYLERRDVGWIIYDVIYHEHELRGPPPEPQPCE